MSKKTFSEQDIEILSKNKYVKNVSEKSITYTNEFKIHFIAEYNNKKWSYVNILATKSQTFLCCTSS